MIDIVRTAWAATRYVTGLAFDPRVHAGNPILWVSHTAPGLLNAPDWTGTISRLSGPNLDTSHATW